MKRQLAKVQQLKGKIASLINLIKLGIKKYIVQLLDAEAELAASLPQQLQIVFPQLVGSEKQIVWAESIRAEAIRKVKAVTKNNEEKIQKLLNKQTKASWWIDNRFSKTVEWVEEVQYA